MGHGIHQSLAADQGYLMSDTPLTLAKLHLCLQKCLLSGTADSQNDAKVRRYLLAGKEDMLNTVVRQVVSQFETQFHDQAGRNQG